MTPDATPRIVSRHIHESRLRRRRHLCPRLDRGVAVKPRSRLRCAEGAGLDGGDRGRSTSLGPSIEPDNPVSLNATGANAPMNAFATSRIYTSLTDATPTR